MAENGKNGCLLSLMMSSWGSGGPETRKRLVTAFAQNDHFTLKVGLPRNSQYVDFACNPEGDTLLHLATRRMNEKAVKMLLRIGADPNARNRTGRTPLHEAAITGSLRILQNLVEYGGDLRLHDANHQNPRQLTSALAQDKKMDITYYIEVMRFLATCYNTYETEVMVTHRKLKNIKKPQSSRAPSAPLPEINCLGFGVFCTEKDKTCLISCVPFVRERELIMVFNRSPFINGPFTTMVTMTLDRSAVTVRKLRPRHNPTNVDILITECTHQRRLRHPGLLFLMAVFNSARLDSIGLVFEHVSVGSLYSVLHIEKRSFPPKQISNILCQICDALMYIHKQQLVHNSISSQAIQLVNEKTAKLTNFEYMNYVNDSPSNWLILHEERSLKDSVWRWLSPELLEERIPSFKSDLFSFCCVIWELYHRRIPWHDLTLSEVKSNYRIGKTLDVKSPDVMKVFKVQLKSGLSPTERHRNVDFEEMRMSLIKESVKTYVERGTDSQFDLVPDVSEDPSIKDSTNLVPVSKDPLKNDSVSANLIPGDVKDEYPPHEIMKLFEMPQVTKARRASIAEFPKEHRLTPRLKIDTVSEDINDSSETGATQIVPEDIPMTDDDDSVSGNVHHKKKTEKKKKRKKNGSVRELIKVFESSLS